MRAISSAIRSLSQGPSWWLSDRPRGAVAQGRRCNWRNRHFPSGSSTVHRQADCIGANFAAQAVIAIENTRLLNELRESLDRQTATADILRVIAGTPEDSKRALDTIAETASRMFDSANVNFRRLEGNVLRVVSAAGPSFAKLREVVPDAPLEPPTEPGVRCVLENRQIAVQDRLATPPNEHGEIDRALHDLARRGLPIRSQAFTPLLRRAKR